jgi:prepilin-type N-terminal cleavage/methylation domain-containing protein
MSRVGARRLAREESGFTLPEMMVTIMVMIVVLFALYSIFDMSIRVFSFGNDKVEAVENARLGLEKLEREMRAAFPRDKANNEHHLFWNPGSPTTAALPASNSVTFGNDLNGNHKIDVATEQITYSLSGTTLQRNSQPVVGFVQDVDEPPDGTALTFVYLDANGNTVTSGNEADIAMVRITLEIAVVPGTDYEATQKLTTDIDLRNR